MQKNNTAVQLTIVIVLAIITLLGVSTLLSLGMQPASVLAQGAISTPPAAFTPAPLSDFGLAFDELSTQAQDDKFDLAILKTTNVVSVASGTRVTYTLTITNNGPQPAQYFYVYDNAPAELTGIEYTFPAGVDALSNDAANPQYFITSVLPNTGVMVVTVTGVLTSLRGVQVVNTAVVTPFVQTADTNGGNNTSSKTVSVTGSDPLANTLFLPFVLKFPTPTPPPIVQVYYESFDSGTPWAEFDNNGCDTDHSSGQYWVLLQNDSNDCLPPADENDEKPESPYRTYGEFEVRGYHSEGTNDDLALGIFINGQGADNYYLYRVWPNGNQCGTGRYYELRRRRNGSTTTLIGACSTAIKSGMGSSSINTLRIAHNNNRQLLLYANGTLINTYNENSTQHLTGTATGVYVKGVGNDVLVKFDDFRVFKYQ